MVACVGAQLGWVSLFISFSLLSVFSSPPCFLFLYRLFLVVPISSPTWCESRGSCAAAKC